MNPAIGIIGGSGVSGFEGLENVEERNVTTGLVFITAWQRTFHSAD